MAEEFQEVIMFLDSDDEKEEEGVRKQPEAHVASQQSDKEIAAETRDPSNTRTTNFLGFRVCKKFNDGQWYNGQVVDSRPSKVEVTVKGKSRAVQAWKVLYEDGEDEDMERKDLARWDARKRKAKDSVDAKVVSSSDGASDTTDSEQPDGANTGRPAKVAKKPSAALKEPYAAYQAAKKDLCYRMGVKEEEVIAVLDAMDGPPYKLNEAMKRIHEARVAADYKDDDDETDEKFSPYVGMKVRKYLEGFTWIGKVTKDAEMHEITMEDETRRIRMWEVTFDDGDKEDMTFEELLQSRDGRPIRHHPVRGRQLTFWELFSGCGRVSQEFCERRWRIRSVDNDPKSSRTDGVDFLKLTFDNVGPLLPDCIWMSPPCFTYSNLSGGTHRSATDEDYEKTPEARLHNTFLTRMAFIMRFVLKHKPHAIFIIENPVGALSKMPLMQQIVQDFDLHRAQVHYCALGRDDKKPTYLWTNVRLTYREYFGFRPCSLNFLLTLLASSLLQSFDLYSRLNVFQCGRKCPYYGGTHPLGARAHGREYNAAAIPRFLAEETAACVDHLFYHWRTPHTTKEVEMTPDMIAEFNRGVNDSEL